MRKRRFQTLKLKMFTATVNQRHQKTRKQPPREQPFMDNWLQLAEFKTWLVKIMGNDKKVKLYCRICEKTLTCPKTALKRHASSKKQQEKIKTAATSSFSQMANHATSAEATTSMEVKLHAFSAQHNLSLSFRRTWSNCFAFSFHMMLL